MGSERCEKNGVQLAKTTIQFSIDIPEWLLVEVLIRLPVKLVFRFKLVSKQWHSVVSDPSFTRMYVSRASMLPDQSQNWTFICPNLSVGVNSCSHFPLLYSQHLKFPRFHVVSCSCTELPFWVDYRIVGVSNGLVLCVQTRSSTGDCYRCCRSYYLCNPITGQSVCLPPHARPSESRHCSSFVTHVENGRLTSYRVVLVFFLDSSLTRSNVIRFRVFISEISEWKDFDVYAGPKIKVLTSATSLNGILYWITKRHGMMAYDPYLSPNNLRFIALPHDIDPTRINELDGIVCDARQGKLRYFVISKSGTCFGIWILNDFSTGDWCLQHRISFADILYDDIPDYDGLFVEKISFHPFDSEIVYLVYRSQIVSYNIKTRKLARHGPPNLVLSICTLLDATLFVIPPWPTSISTPSF